MRKIIVLLLFIILLSGCGSETPVDVTLNEGNDTIEINTVWVDAGAQVTFGTTNIVIYSSTQLDTSVSGLTEMLYTVTINEETYELTRYVIVTDQTPPTIVLNFGLDTIKTGEEWTDSGVTVFDNSGETLTYTTSGTVDENVPNTYEITYTAVDSFGNTSTISRFVHVVD